MDRPIRTALLVYCRMSQFTHYFYLFIYILFISSNLSLVRLFYQKVSTNQIISRLDLSRLFTHLKITLIKENVEKLTEQALYFCCRGNFNWMFPSYELFM